MKPPRFDYYAPATLSEALELLDQHGEEAKVLAGGQSLLPLLNMRLTRPKVVVDINGLHELEGIRLEGDALCIGALTRHRAVENSPLVRQRLPILHEAIRWVGYPAIRTRGTIGGSIAHADPAAELPAIWTALDGEVVVRNMDGTRSLRPAEFFLSYMLTTLEPRDLLVEVRLPLPNEGTGWAFEEVSGRHGDFALVGVAVLIEKAGDGTVASARIAVMGCGATPLRAQGAEALVAGRTGGPSLWEEAGRQVSEEIDPADDIHASASYRRRVAGELTRRCLELAWQRAR